MNLEHLESDPVVKRQLALRRVRGGLWRSTIFWTPLFLLSAVGLVFFFFGELTGNNGQGWVLPVILVFLAILFGYQSVQSIRDLRGDLRKAEGAITRHWSRTDSVIMRSHYLRLDSREIFRVEKVQHRLLKKGDYVALEYYPATMVVVIVEKQEAPEREPADAMAPIEGS